jgi:hypothetical protein
MEALARMVADSLARHGFHAPVDHRRLEWSRWFRCESSFSLLLVPSAAGIYALGEEILAPGEIPAAAGKRMLAVFQVAQAEDLCVALSRLFAPKSPLAERLSAGRCFVRFAQIADADQRHGVCESFRRWLTSSAEAVTGVTRGLGTAKDFATAKDFVTQSDVTSAPAAKQTEPRESSLDAPQSEPPPLPAGF